MTPVDFYKIFCDKKTVSNIENAISNNNAEEVIQDIFFSRIANYSLLFPRNQKTSCNSTKNNCSFTAPYKNPLCGINLSQEGWHREVGCDFKKSYCPYLETPRVDFVSFEINSSKSTAPTQLVELKIFKPGKPGHEYPILTQTGCCDWYCFPRISGKQIVTNSDEGILFFDLIKMLSFKERNPSYDLQLFELIIIDKMNLKLVDSLYQAFTDMFNTFISLQAPKRYYEISDYSDVSGSTTLTPFSFCYGKTVKVVSDLEPDFFIVEFSKIKIVIMPPPQNLWMGECKK